VYHYSRWGGESGLGNNLAPFVTGSANMIESIGITHALAVAIMGVFVASFAATTLDSACRLQRYVIAELAGAGTMTLTSEEVCAACGYPSGRGVPLGQGTPSGRGTVGPDEKTRGPECPAPKTRGPECPAPEARCPECGGTDRRFAPQPPRHAISRFLGNRYIATGIAVATAAALALSDAYTGAGGFATAVKGALILWPIFGATNQLLGGLALLVVTVWLVRHNRPAWVTAIPMVFMLAMTGWAIASLVRQFADAEGKLHLLIVGLAMLVLEVWIVVEAVALVWRARRVPTPGPVG